MADVPLCGRHPQLGRAKIVGGVLGLLVQILAGDAEEHVVLTDGAALPDAKLGHGAGGSGHDGLLALVGKVGRVEGADAVHLRHCGLRSGQAARVGHRDGDGAGHKAGVTGGVCARYRTDGAVQHLKGGVRHDLCGLTDGEALGLGGGEIHGQQHHRGVADGGDGLTGLHRVASGHGKGADLAADLRADVPGVGSVIVAALGLRH